MSKNFKKGCQICTPKRITCKRGHTPNVKPTKQCKACSLENLCVPKLQKAMKAREYIERNITENDKST